MGIDRVLVVDGQVDVDLFTERSRAGITVGQCDCGGLLTGSVTRGRGVTWLTTTCPDCGAERSAPGGRVTAPRSRAVAWASRPAWLRQAGADRDAAILGERAA